MDDTRLGSLLREGKMVDEKDLERCLEIQALTGGVRPLGHILVEQNMISASELEELLQIQQQRRAVNFQPVQVEGQGVERILCSAASLGASELIISEGKPVTVRVAGQLQVLTEEPVQPPEVWQFLQDNLGPDVLETLAEKRWVSQEFQRQGIGRGRIMASRHLDGACVVVRLHQPQDLPAAQAGLTSEVLSALAGGQGLFLVTGEAGSGISFTLHHILAEVVRDGAKFIQVLDESHEFSLPESDAIVVRRKVGRDVKDYKTGIESAIREESDVIVLGDASSPSVFDLALHAAECGCQVIAAVPAHSVQAMLARIMNFYPEHDLQRVRASLASVLKLTLRPQLVPDKEGLKSLLASELLLMDASAREVVRSGSLGRLSLLMNMDCGSSGHSVDQSLDKLLQAGEIHLEDAFRFADEKSRVLKFAKKAVRV